MVLKVWVKEKVSTEKDTEAIEPHTSIKPALLSICGTITALVITVILIPKKNSQEPEDHNEKPAITNHTQGEPVYTHTQPYHLYEQEPQPSWEELSEDFFRQKITNHIEAKQLAVEFVETHYPDMDKLDKQALKNQMTKMLYVNNIDFSDIANCQIIREMTIIHGYQINQYLQSIRPQGNPNILLFPHQIDQTTKQGVVDIIKDAISQLPMSIDERNILAEQWLPIVWTEAFNDAKMWAPHPPSIRFSEDERGGSTSYEW